MAPGDIAWPMIAGGALCLGIAVGLGRRAWAERNRTRKLDKFTREYEERLRYMYEVAIEHAHAEMRFAELAKELPERFEPTIFHAMRMAHGIKADYMKRATALGIFPSKTSESSETGTALRATGAASESTSRPPDAPQEGGPARELGPKSGRTIAFPFRRTSKGED